MSAQLSIGNELKDSYKTTYGWVSANIKWLKEIEQFYLQRARIEKEYSEKLNALTSEYLNKTSSSTVLLSVGETPTVTPGSVEIASVVTWNDILAQTESISKDHAKLSNDFEKTVAAQANGLNVKLDFTLTKINGFNNDLEDKKKGAKNDLDKAKKAYDDSCENVEVARNKLTKSNNERNKRKLEDKQVDMNVAKNDYLIKINQANRIKDKYYFQDVPEVVDLLQDLNESKILLLNDIWKAANDSELQFGKNINDRLIKSNDVISHNKPSLSTAMFIKHNLKGWKEPKDFQYVPSPIWHEDETFTVPSENEVQDLRIKLKQAENDYNRLDDLTKSELSKLSSFNKIKQTLKEDIEANGNNGNNGQKFYENLKSYLSVISSFVLHETTKLQAEVTVESIQNNVPEEYDLSTENIDLNKSKRKSSGGLFSKFKGLNILSDVNNGGSSRSSGGGHSNGISLFGGSHNKKSSTSNNSHDGNDKPDNESMFSSETTHTHTTTKSKKKSSSNAGGNGNKVLYAYEGQDSDEISMSVGDQIELIAVDSGSGWTKIKNLSTGDSGLVPTSYVHISSENRKAASPPSVPPPRRSAVPTRTLTATFAYEAQDSDELSLSAGDVITVIKGDDGSGWTYGEVNGEKGLVPTSYCK
ncbi:similar to Saccharomyces cerevisiae YHR114W BZZ1 SH3 domain protein implicated in the regulation of actin polymerization [Maudiozyma saulgeensis]|uniref:Protein BZZ1 n=1 Tax=Maudiozyma saulgeensis TaxID=1789683 RepID=A0A1X7QZQ8_9SACH|nr:similar to Saccharomyces cerevisiae YHR114W BZZ1 SH3 domain protein implicated in the regulation of actin polymerization [Kazachstania saulgeensis]